MLYHHGISPVNRHHPLPFGRLYIGDMPRNATTAVPLAPIAVKHMTLGHCNVIPTNSSNANPASVTAAVITPIAIRREDADL